MILFIYKKDGKNTNMNNKLTVTNQIEDDAKSTKTSKTNDKSKTLFQIFN